MQFNKQYKNKNKKVKEEKQVRRVLKFKKVYSITPDSLIIQTILAVKKNYKFDIQKYIFRDFRKCKIVIWCKKSDWVEIASTFYVSSGDLIEEIHM